jgi:hypothetical protein
MRQLRIGTWALSLLVAVGLGMPGGAWGQALPDGPARVGEVQVVAPSLTPRTFGTAGSTAHVITALEFHPTFYWSCPGFVDGVGLSARAWMGTG